MHCTTLRKVMSVLLEGARGARQWVRAEFSTADAQYSAAQSPAARPLSSQEALRHLQVMKPIHVYRTFDCLAPAATSAHSTASVRWR